jgi:murein DD-endopeptidase
MNITGRLLFFIMLISFESAYGQEYQPTLDMQIPQTPDRVMISGKPRVYYELHLTNFSGDSIALKTLDVLNTADSSIIFSADNDDLNKRYSKIGPPQLPKGNILAPGATGIIYLEFTLRNKKSNIQLSHRLQFEIRRKDKGELSTVQGGIITISNAAPIVLGAPLKTGVWAAIYDPSWSNGHRRVVYTINGKARIPGRFAIDFIKMDTLGRYASQDNDIIKNWYGYANDVLAVADGTIATIRNDFSESPTLSGHPGYTADKATGNYISIAIGNDHFAFYEHLKPGSIKVKPGQRVKKGDVIASLGFTGQTTGPHLHFHIANVNSPLGAEGIPFVFDHFILLGQYADLENFGKLPWVPVKGKRLITRGERPAPNSVIEF